MSNPIVPIIKKIKDSEFAKLRINDREGNPVDFDCIYKEDQAPDFYLVFPPNTIPDYIEPPRVCTISIHAEDDSTVLNASIESQQGDRTLHLKAIELIDPVSLREYFRVFFKTSLTASHEPTSENPNTRPWTVNGDTVDLSGTGVLAIFPHKLENNHNIFLDFTIPNTDKSIHCVAHVVRTRKIRKTRFQVALHFDHITRKNRDAVITACLQEQRKQLRERMESG